MSGVMTIPLIAGLFVSSTVSGQVITKTGRWKSWLVSGGVLVTAGLGLLGTMRYDTEYWRVAIFMAVMGLGLGMMMQNLVLCTQNQVPPEDLGAASSVVTFFRSLGGAVGVSVLGAVMANRVTHYVKDGLAELGPQGASMGHGGTAGGGIPDLDKLPGPIRTVMESAYGHGVADVFLYSAPFGLLAFLVTLFIKEVALKSHAAQYDILVSETGGRGVTRIEAVLQAGALVQGTVRGGADRRLLTDARVSVVDAGGDVAATATTGDDGAYAFAALDAGQYTLIATCRRER